MQINGRSSEKMALFLEPGYFIIPMLMNNPFPEVSLELKSPTMLKLSPYVLMTLSINMVAK
jgi:hypothetical protein